MSNVLEHFLNKKQGELFNFDNIPDTRYIKSEIHSNIKQTSAVDRFITQLQQHIDEVVKLKGGQVYTVGAIKKFCKDRKLINKFIRQKANEKLIEIKKQGDVEWLNQ